SMLPTAIPSTTPWRVASARRRHQCAGLRRRCGLAISYRLPRLARAPTGATGCLVYYLDDPLCEASQNCVIAIRAPRCWRRDRAVLSLLTGLSKHNLPPLRRDAVTRAPSPRSREASHVCWRRRAYWIEASRDRSWTIWNVSTLFACRTRSRLRGCESER